MKRPSRWFVAPRYHNLVNLREESDFAANHGYWEHLVAYYITEARRWHKAFCNAAVMVEDLEDRWKVEEAVEQQLAKLQGWDE